ncbi:MAG: DUF1015 domain-containing protein, partial [Chloroflexi bacterium]
MRMPCRFAISRPTSSAATSAGAGTGSRGSFALLPMTAMNVARDMRREDTGRVAEITPFHGLRYEEKIVGDLANVIAPPYDVISPAQQEELYARDPFNIVRLELAKAEAGDDEIHNRYERANRTLADWTERGALHVDYAPALYLYDHHFPFRGRRLRRRGFFAALRLYDWGRGLVRPHEQTFAGPKQDRLWLLRATRTNISPVFTLYDDADALVRGFLEDAIAHGPAELVADVRQGQERHLLFRMEDRFATR